MITFRRFGERVSIEKSDWKELKKRFDIRRAIPVGGKIKINVLCPLCKRYIIERPAGTRCCRGCPFLVFEAEDGAGCEIFLKKVLTDDFVWFFAGLKSVTWHPDVAERVHAQFKEIREFMHKIEVEQHEANRIPGSS